MVRKRKERVEEGRRENYKKLFLDILGHATIAKAVAPIKVATGGISIIAITSTPHHRYRSNRSRRSLVIIIITIISAVAVAAVVAA